MGKLYTLIVRVNLESEKRKESFPITKRDFSCMVRLTRLSPVRKGGRTTGIRLGVKGETVDNVETLR